MRNLKNREAYKLWPDDTVVMYSFFPLFDDELELSPVRKQTVMRLVKWLLQTVNITPMEFLAQAQKDEPNKGDDAETD